jgi:CO/xanthine dehydrogenase FAD-binding subunit
MSFAVRVPESAEQVVTALSEGGEVIAGGTVVMPRINTRPLEVDALVSLRRAGLHGVSVSAGVATLGATTPLAQIGREESLSFLAPAIETIASPSIRNLATVGGNLFVAQPYGDLAVCLLALEADVAITGSGGLRSAPVAAVLADGVAGDEVVTAVSFELPEPGTWFFTKAMRRRQNSASIVTVAATVTVTDGTVTGARIALGGAGPRPVRATSAETALVGNPLDRAGVEACCAAALHDAQPFDDAYASAWYRRRVLGVHLRRALLGE